jgi:hypothetical protein
MSAAQVGLDADDLLTLMHGSDPVKVELNRLENEARGEPIRDSCYVDSSFGFFSMAFLGSYCVMFRVIFEGLIVQCLVFLPYEVLDKDRELGEAHAEIKALRLSERAREKAVEEVTAHCSMFFMLCSLRLGIGIVSVSRRASYLVPNLMEAPRGA